MYDELSNAYEVYKLKADATPDSFEVWEASSPEAIKIKQRYAASEDFKRQTRTSMGRRSEWS